MKKLLAIASLSTMLVLFSTVAARAEGGSNSFLPTWRLLNHEQKQQFIAGYLRGSSDAGKILDIAIVYVKQNPKEAVQGLEKLKQLYEAGNIDPNSVVRELDVFYADPDNQDSSLSKAVSFAKGRLR